jgi:enterochelin esterase-like enzyme
MASDLAYGPQSAHSLRYRADELKPFIDASHRSLPGPDDTFMMGASRGALISFYAACVRPELFGAAATSSAAARSA